LQNALICGVNDFDGRENTIPMYVHKCVLGQLPQPAFTSEKKEPKCHCISINKDRSSYCVPNYRKIPSQPVKKCYSYLLVAEHGTCKQESKQASKQESLQAEQPTDQTNQPLPPYQWWNRRWMFRCLTSHGEQEVSACQKCILLNECSYMLLL